MGWDIKIMDDVFVRGGNGGFLLTAAGSLICSAPVVVIGCMLNGFVGLAVGGRTGCGGFTDNGHGGGP